MAIQILQLDSTWIKPIVELRRICYSAQYGDAVQIDRLGFNDIDQQSVHFGAVQGADLLSVFRATIVTTPDLFERILLISSAHPPSPYPVRFPIGTLARATTRPGYAKLGLHSRLRWEALKWFAANDVNQVWGTLSQSAFQINQMKALGYELFAAPSADSKLISYERTPLVACLDLNQNRLRIGTYFQAVL